MARQPAVDKSVLEAALIGLEHQKSEIDAKVAEIRRRLRGLGASATIESAAAPAAPSRKRKRVLSPAARKRIADATRKRWAEYRAKKAGSKKPGRKATKKTASAATPASA